MCLYVKSLTVTSMSYVELYVSDTFNYLGGRRGNPESINVVIGVPFDSTSSFRVGARYAPQRIRETSQYIETYSCRANADFDDVNYYDAGDIAMIPDIENMLIRVERVISELSSQGKRPIILGGEHTVTLGVIKGMLKSYEDLKIVILDAHLDLRDEYPEGQKVSHATVTRRLLDEVNPSNILLIGIRAFSRYELEVASKFKVRYLTPYELSRLRLSEVLKELRNFMSSNRYYISLDLDVIDPSYAPAVQNPEIEGLTPTVVLDILHELCNGDNFVGFDIVEYTPLYDHSGVTSVLAAKIVCEVITYTFVKS